MCKAYDTWPVLSIDFIGWFSLQNQRQILVLILSADVKSVLWKTSQFLSFDFYHAINWIIKSVVSSAVGLMSFSTWQVCVITGNTFALHCRKDHSDINRKTENLTLCKIVTPKDLLIISPADDAKENIFAVLYMSRDDGPYTW